MEIQRAKEILTALADGVNPLTGELLPPQDSCNQVEIVRALHTALKELDGVSKTAKQQPQNAGKPWTEYELNKLENEYNSRMSIRSIAKEHGRSKGAIEAKLADLGIIESTYFTRRLK